MSTKDKRRMARLERYARQMNPRMTARQIKALAKKVAASIDARGKKG